MVVYNGQIYIRGSDNKIYRYGGSDNNTFDRCRATVELPWLDIKEAGMTKQVMGIQCAIKGKWAASASTDPRATPPYTEVFNRGSSTSPNIVEDSSFDLGHFPFSGNGTHIKIKMVSDTYVTEAKLGKIVIQYTPTNQR
jgi:hypothetical protein